MLYISEIFGCAANGSKSNDCDMKRFWRKLSLALWDSAYKIFPRIPYYGVCKFLIYWKYFAWRDCKNILPSLSNLQKRGIVFDDSCEECRDEGDSSGHFFWRCPCSALIWSHKAIFYAINRPRFLDFMDITCYGFY